MHFFIGNDISVFTYSHIYFNFLLTITSLFVYKVKVLVSFKYCVRCTPVNGAAVPELNGV